MDSKMLRNQIEDAEKAVKAIREATFIQMVKWTAVYMRELSAKKTLRRTTLNFSTGSGAASWSARRGNVENIDMPDQLRKLWVRGSMSGLGDGMLWINCHIEAYSGYSIARVNGRIIELP